MKNPKQQTQEVLLPVRAFSRLSSGQHLGNTSPPASPRISSPRLRSSSRTRSGRIQQWQSHGPSLQVQLHHHQLHQQRSRDLVHTCRKLLQRFAAFILSVLLRRRGVFLLAPLFYISGMLFYMSYIPMDVPVVSNTLPPGSSYRSPELFRLLWPKMQNSTSFFKLTDAWQKMKDGGKWRPCPDNLVSSKGLQNSSGFIIIEANGGLNQQRSSICNAVALAGILNATLVVPSFHFNSVWQDPSVFGEIYDEDYFIESLVGTVRVVKSLPDYVLASFGNNRSLIPNIKVKAWAPASFYTDTVLPKLLEKGAIRIAPFANRLSFEKIPLEFQKLRCFANFEALRFAQPIAATGRRLVELMRARSVINDGKYVAVHLRFEEDMVAFSCCVYDGGEEEKLQLDAARERGWRGKFNRPGRVNDPAAFRRDGKCPLTPLEVGMMLRGIGFRNDTPIYLAAGKIYKADESMAPLREMFPWLQTKETLLSLEELEPFTKFSSRLAALDYTVCLHSEVFVTTQGGNFPQFLMGHRRYLYNGHSKTLKPDKRKLAVLFDNPELRWETFTEHMRSMWRHSDSKGRELRKASASIYTYPVPECMCSKESGESVSSAQQKTINVSSTTEDYF